MAVFYQRGKYEAVDGDLFSLHPVHPPVNFPSYLLKVLLFVQAATHHEVHGQGLESGPIGRLQIGALPQLKAATAIEVDASSAQLVGWQFYLQYDGEGGSVAKGQ